MANNQADGGGDPLGGKGKVMEDRGLAGAPISEEFEKKLRALLRRNIPASRSSAISTATMPHGPEQEGVAALLAAHPQVDGILSQGYGTGAIDALQNADRALVPIVAAAFNGTGVACAQTEGAKCWLGANPPSLSAEATKLAVDVLDGKQPADKTVLFNSPGLTTDMVDAKYSPNSGAVKIELGKTVFPDLAPGLSLPVSPDWGDHRAGSLRHLSGQGDEP